jgi:ubiquinone/menaquinone biosynthesis C-methylase UbiE
MTTLQIKENFMQNIDFWNEIGSKKDFEDPLNLDRLKPFINKNSKIVEYGCGYGRLMKSLKDEGYPLLTGYDISHKMLERGKKENPNLDLRLLEDNYSFSIPEEDSSTDLVILSTILCCVPCRQEQKELVNEIHRILKPKGIVYLSDFLISDEPYYQSKYLQGLKDFEEMGIYTTAEGLTVRHHTTFWITKLFRNFDIQWLEQFDLKTMNNHPARVICSIAQKKVLPNNKKFNPFFLC